MRMWNTCSLHGLCSVSIFQSVLLYLDTIRARDLEVSARYNQFSCTRTVITKAPMPLHMKEKLSGSAIIDFGPRNQTLVAVKNKDCQDWVLPTAINSHKSILQCTFHANIWHIYRAEHAKITIDTNLKLYILSTLMNLHTEFHIWTQ